MHLGPKIIMLELDAAPLSAEKIAVERRQLVGAAGDEVPPTGAQHGVRDAVAKLANNPPRPVSTINTETRYFAAIGALWQVIAPSHEAIMLPFRAGSAADDPCTGNWPSFMPHPDQKRIVVEFVAHHSVAVVLADVAVNPCS